MDDPGVGELRPNCNGISVIHPLHRDILPGSASPGQADGVVNVLRQLGAEEAHAQEDRLDRLAGSLADEEYTSVAYQRYLKKFLRSVRGVDDGIGRVIRHLEDTNQLDNTIIIMRSASGTSFFTHSPVNASRPGRMSRSIESGTFGIFHVRP